MPMASTNQTTTNQLPNMSQVYQIGSGTNNMEGYSPKHFSSNSPNNSNKNSPTSQVECEPNFSIGISMLTISVINH